MKNIFLSAIAILLLVFASCGDENDKNEQTESKNYWESNDLRKLQLKGKVRIFSSCAIDGTLEFDNKGRITKYTKGDGSICFYQRSLTDEESLIADAKKNETRAARDVPSTEGKYTETYQYNSSGQLVSAEINNYGTIRYASLEYSEHEAYVPYNILKLRAYTNFRKNLSKVRFSYKDFPNDYDLDSVAISGDKMTIYSYSVTTDQLGKFEKTHKDTTHITLNDAKYPIKVEKNGIEDRYEYYDNNMLKKSSYEDYKYSMWSSTTYIKDDEYLLPESWWTGLGKTTYIYNDKKDLIKEYIQEYIYTADSYDENDNWIKRTVRWPDHPVDFDTTDSRVILYY